MWEVVRLGLEDCGVVGVVRLDRESEEDGGKEEGWEERCL